MKLTTTNFEDFKTLIHNLFGATPKVYHGCDGVHRNRVKAFVKNGDVAIVFVTEHGYPEGFTQYFQSETPLQEIFELEIEA